MTPSPRLKLGLDARLYGRRGIGRYVSGLLEGLEGLKLPLDLVAFASDGFALPLSGGGKGEGHGSVTSRSLPRANYALQEQRDLPRMARDQGRDILHLVDNMGARNYQGLQVVTVHDLFFLDSPGSRQRGAGWKAWAAWLYRKRYFRKSLQGARKIICPSAWTAASLGRFAPETFRRTIVARPGVGRPFSRDASTRSVATFKKYGLPSELILVPGAAERRKNVAAAVEGFFQAKWKGLSPNFQLAIYGMDEKGLERHWPELLTRLRAKEIRVLGVLPDEDLAALLAGASCLLFPSLGEGVGFPALEAAACACPVIAGKHSAVPEFMADGALYTEGGPEDIADRILELMGNQERKSALAELGLRRAALFTWAACAEAHWAVYRSCLPGGGPD